jgi:hypothetical protein
MNYLLGMYFVCIKSPGFEGKSILSKVTVSTSNDQSAALDDANQNYNDREHQKQVNKAT